MKTLMWIAAAAALVQETPAATGGKLDWRRDYAAAEKRAKLEQRALLVYFTDGGMPCRALDGGAWSASQVVSASSGVIPVLLECPDDKAHAELRTKLKVTGFPTVLIVEPDLKTHAEFLPRDTAEVVAELRKVAGKFPGREVLWLSSMEKALEKAKEEKKPLAIYFHAATDDLADAQARIVKVAGAPRADKFVWVELPATNDEKDPLKSKYNYYSLPAVALLDPRFDEPRRLTVFEVREKSKPKEIQEKIEKALKKYKDTKIK